MLVFFNYIRTYFKEDFDAINHLLIAVFLSICLYINYTYSVYDFITDTYYKDFLSVPLLFVLYAFGFLGSVALISFRKKEKKAILNRSFLLFGLVGLFFLSLDCSYYYMILMDDIGPENAYVSRWVRACVSNLASFGTIILPLFVLYFATKHFKPELFGLRLNGAKARPYLWLILLMLPLIYLASFRPDFLHTYPTYTDNFEYRFLGVPQWVTAGIYELCYGFDFISVELFFRGFMVIALSRFVGKDALLPMITVYCFLHFGKPAGEAISSIFGGYILGILAYYSRNIHGGLIAHLGVAWGMEYMAYLNG